MPKQREPGAAALLELLLRDPQAVLIAQEGGAFSVSTAGGGRKLRIAAATASELAAAGLITKVGAGGFRPTEEARSWLRRHRAREHSFRMQHGEVVAARGPGDVHPAALIELDESPVAALARRSAKSGEPWLAPHALAASERLRRDFEIGRLQPRVTANWSASVSDGHRDGGRGGIAALTDAALAARLRFDRAIGSVGPELSGVLIDVCCFLKGLEVVERERQWPARSAKLVLRLALDRLARHYGLSETATGKSSADVRHWGAADYRPEIT